MVRSMPVAACASSPGGTTNSITSSRPSAAIRVSAGAEDAGRGFVIPVVQDPGEDVRIAVRGERIGEEVAWDEFAAVGEPGYREPLPSTVDNSQQVEDHAAHMRMGVQHGFDQRAVAAADVDDALDTSEVVDASERGSAQRDDMCALNVAASDDRAWVDGHGVCLFA